MWWLIKQELWHLDFENFKTKWKLSQKCLIYRFFWDFVSDFQDIFGDNSKSKGPRAKIFSYTGLIFSCGHFAPPIEGYTTKDNILRRRATYCTCCERWLILRIMTPILSFSTPLNWPINVEKRSAARKCIQNFLGS